MTTGPADNAQPIALDLAEHVVTTTAFPAEVLERARLGVLDILGCMAGAAMTTTGGRIISYVGARGGQGATTTLGLGGGIRSEDSVLANATLAHMLELDDGHRPSDNHLGCVVVPAALAVAEELGSSASECLEAIVVGYDAMGRVGEATLLPRRLSPFHGTGTTGVFGAAAVAARLMGLDRDQTAHAFAIAGTAAAGLRESTNTGPDCKPLHAGRAASNGVAAAFLAAGGYKGPLTIFEGNHGFCNAMCEEPRPELILAELGERFALIESGFKVHSTCGMLFNLLDGILEARDAHDLGESPPSLVRVGVPSWIVSDPAFSRRRPTSAGEARFSIPFAVAAALIDGEVSPRQMTDDKLRDPAFAEYEEIVEIVEDEEVEEIFQATRRDPFFFYPAAVEIERDGHVYRSVHRNPRGYDTGRPLTRDEVVRKFISSASGLLGEPAAVALMDRALAFDGTASVAELMSALGTPALAPRSTPVSATREG